MRRKQKWLCLAVAGLLVLGLLAGCGEAAGPAADEPVEQEQQEFYDALHVAGNLLKGGAPIEDIASITDEKAGGIGVLNIVHFRDLRTAEKVFVEDENSKGWIEIYETEETAKDRYQQLAADSYPVCRKDTAIFKLPAGMDSAQREQYEALFAVAATGRVPLPVEPIANQRATAAPGTEYQLTAGTYVVGEDIPAGKYDVTWQAGLGNCFAGSMIESFGENTERYIKEYKNLSLSVGDEVEVTRTLQVKFTAK